MTKYLLGAVLLILIGYGGMEAWPLLVGPTLSIATPTNDASYPDGIVAIKGTAMRAATLTLDGMPMLHEENGDFATTLTFPHGSSILTFVATDRFGKQVRATRSVFVPF